MTKVSGVSGAVSSRAGAGIGGTAGRAMVGGFGVPLLPGQGAGTVGVVALSGLIALQEDACPSHRDQIARRGGERVLGALGRVQAAALAGVDNSALVALNDAVAAMTEPADPGLRAIMGAIRLRARVELARLDRRTARI